MVMQLQGWDGKFNIPAAEETQAGAEVAVLQAYRNLLYTVSYLEYLGRVLKTEDEN